MLSPIHVFLVTDTWTSSSIPSVLRRDYANGTRADVYSCRSEYTVSHLSSFPQELQRILRSHGTQSIAASLLVVSLISLLQTQKDYCAEGVLILPHNLPYCRFERRHSFGITCLPTLDLHAMSFPILTPLTRLAMKPPHMRLLFPTGAPKSLD